MTELKAGIYRHYKGPLYLVLGLAHDANAEDLVRREDISLRDQDFTEMGEREVVVYVGLQLDEAHTGARLAVRTLSDFFAAVCGEVGCERFGRDPLIQPRCLIGHRVERFTYLGARYGMGMAQPDDTVTMSQGAFEELRKAVLRGCAGCGRATGHHFDCPSGKQEALTRPVRTSDCDCGVQLGQQHRPSCTFMRKLEANRQHPGKAPSSTHEPVRCEHGVDRSRVTCPPCGVQA